MAIVKDVPPEPVPPEPPGTGAPGVDGEVDSRAFRDVMGRFATGVLVATTRSGGVDHAMTVNSFTSVSLDPLLVLLCAECVSRFRDAVLDAGEWAVSVLPADAVPLARRLAVRGRPLGGQLDDVPHHPGRHTRLPILDDALAAVECATYAVHNAGDHDIVVGRVLSVATPNPGPSPLIYHRGTYRSLPDDPAPD